MHNKEFMHYYIQIKHNMHNLRNYTYNNFYMHYYMQIKHYISKSNNVN